MSDWRDDAACLSADPRIFALDEFEGRRKRIARTHALAYCAGCPVREQCLEAAMEEESHGLAKVAPFGIRGGMTPYMRTALRRRRARAEKSVMSAMSTGDELE